MGLLKQLHDRGLLRASLATARAPFSVSRRKGGITRTESYSVEKDILQVVVAAQDADDVFRFLHQEAGIGTGPGGFMFQGPIGHASEFALPHDLPAS
jgi:hypothetical protein